MRRQKPFLYFLLALSFVLYIVIGYGIKRHDTTPLFICYYLLFLVYAWLLIEWKDDKSLITASILFRAVLLFSVPALSDDVFRFIWDGRLLAAGHHPFKEVPSYYMSNHAAIPGLDAELYSQLNSKINFTVYPTVAQVIFWLSVKIAPDSIYGSIIVMKLILFAFEIGTLYMLSRLLQHFNIDRSRTLIYALNPLVILELTGNLHFEGVMIFFLLLAVSFLLRRKWILSTAFYALSIGTKLIPLIFLPLLLRQLGWKKAIRYWLMTGVLSVLLFLPLVNADILHGFSQGIGYYFRKFEFNGSLYYLVREAGYYIFGYNIIGIAGWVLALISTALILTLSFRNIKHNGDVVVNSRLFAGMMWCLLIFALFTPTLHPWYIIPLIVFCTFTRFRFPLVWSALIFLTYAGYTPQAFTENLLLVAVEYCVVLGYLIYELIWTNRASHS